MQGLFACIIAGGSGSRLWPLSRSIYPKQFLALNSHLTVLQETAARLNGMASSEPVIICNEEHRFLVAEQMRQQGHKASILLEPAGRNTAPAIALAAMQIMRTAEGADQAPVMLILAADHVIRDTNAFQQATMQLLPAVQAGKFGTLGIVPTEAATGYGYIKVGSADSDVLFAVEQFVEKPDQATAQQYFTEKTDQGANKWLWNSGMFMVRADRYLAALKQYRPDIYSACELAMQSVTQDRDFIRVDAEAFEACPAESIDYAVMEPLSKEADCQIVVSPLDAGWSDVGSWSALWDLGEKDLDGNVVIHSQSMSKDDVILKDTHGSLVSVNSRLVTTLGVNDLIIVDTADALLVASKDKAQDIKALVAELDARGRNEHLHHREVHRPWGKYEVIYGPDVSASEDHYLVKKVTVKPGASLSLQRHGHRAEHWVVVSGVAQVTNGEETFLVEENQSTYIPVGQVHCLRNPGNDSLELIEVQSGSYLSEDDIVRLKDEYGRT